MRKIALMAWLLAFVAGCAGGGKTDPGPAAVPAGFDAASATPEYVAALPRNQANAAIDAMVDSFIAQTHAQCIAEIVGFDCLNRRYAAAFDPDRQFAHFCDTHGTGDEYRLCLMIAAETVPLITAAGGDPRVDIDWSNIDDMNNAGRKTLMDDVLQTCSQDKGCIITQMAQRLNLSRFVADSCREHARFLDQLNCMSDSISARVYRRAIDASATEGN